MALRPRSRTATPTSGPGRGPASDGRARHRSTGHRRARHRPPAPAQELRRRADLLFGQRAVQWRESGNGPPDERRPPATTAADADADVGAGTEAGGGAGTGAVTDPVTTPAAVAVPAPGSVGQAVDAVADARSEPEPGADAEPGTEPAGAALRPGVAGTFAPGRRERIGAALRERMPVWLQARCGVERRTVAALAVLLAAVAAFAVQHFWAGRTQSVSAPQAVRVQAPFAGPSAGRGVIVRAAGGAVRAPATPGGEIVVDVTGKVREPGIRRLPAGSRVADALRAAGGARPGVSTDGLNRARFLVDGEQVVVGAPAGVPAPPPGSGAGTGAGPAGPPVGAGPAAPVSLSTATVDQLDALPGVGPVLAQHIVDYRTRHGGFRSVGELRQVNGIGDRRFSDLRDLVRP
ncbi:ComEA family DNA-binding protein [Streptomyces sp. TG1A-8]|uniref:ComEA family DNA-binding protein n=1 Tax=Streptomyces sp. TG1A-8 TaxID=3051385 RepID=UPI00265B8753|nr:ComEA family DNA-binding protein [Streptomyces sp. TG1A-8]MDO0927766.1 ComEA family DNA-binding protein [Streptomyces sp. TG1A-8]